MGGITDPQLLMQLEAPQQPNTQGGVTDPAILQQLEAQQAPQVPLAGPVQQAQPSGPNQDNWAEMLNAPGAGIGAAAMNTAMGASQLIGDTAMPDHATIPRWVPGIGGLDIGRVAGNQGINDIKQMRDEELVADTKNQPVASGLYTGGEIGGDVGQFAGLAGTMPVKYAEALRAFQKIGLPEMAAKTAAEASLYAPAATAGYVTSGLQPAATPAEHSDNANLGALTAGLGEGAGKTISSEVTDPTKNAVMDIANQYGIPIYRNQLWGNANPGKFASALMRMLPGGGAEGRIASQTDAFNDRAMQQVGGSGTVTPEAVDAQFQNNANGFNTLMPKYNVPVGKTFRNDMNAAVNAPGLGKLTADKQNILDQHIQAINDAVQNAATGAPSAGQGIIPGSDLHNIQSGIGADMRGATSSPQLGNLRDFLHDQFEGAVTDPADLGKYGSLRQQYRDLLVLNHVVGQNPNGVMQPQQLQAAAKKIYSDYGYANTQNGATGMEQLARLGATLKDNVKSSGTTENTAVKEFMKHAAGVATGGLIGAGAGAEEDGGHGALMGAAAGIPLAYLASHGAVNPYLFTKMSTNPSVARATAPALANALFNYGNQ